MTTKQTDISNVKNLLSNASKFSEAGEIINMKNTIEDAFDILDGIKVNNNYEVIDLGYECSKIYASNIFLLGKNYFKDAELYATTALEIAHNENNNLKKVECYNIFSKIYQRKCDFDNAERVLKEALPISDHSNLAIIHHNLGSLYWTRAKDTKDYEDAELNLIKSIEIQSERISTTQKPSERNKLIKYQSVSKMILGAVYGLLRKTNECLDTEREAYQLLNKQDIRRSIYAAYYLVLHHWDQKRFFNKEVKLDIDELHEIMLTIGEFSELSLVDEKSLIINKIFHFRKAIGEDGYENAKERANSLFEQLEDMKYRNRYYDVDTCTSSAFLDYAIYVKKRDYLEARESLQRARLITQGVEYYCNDKIAEMSDIFLLS